GGGGRGREVGVGGGGGGEEDGRRRCGGTSEAPEEQVALVVDRRVGVPLRLDRQDEVAVGVVAVAGTEELGAGAVGHLLERLDPLVEDVVLGDGVLEGRRAAGRVGVEQRVDDGVRAGVGGRRPGDGDGQLGRGVGGGGGGAG